ncbi:MAG: alanine racemase [Acidimicrobiia bacterium]|nr:alanine racemase [Acidimicrobiia bacterium]
MIKTSFRPSKIVVDLKAITHNLKQFRNITGSSKISVAVKSNAYGHGIVIVAKHLEAIGVDMLLVSSAEEALELRENDISIPILILSEVPREAIEQCWQNNITFTVYTEEFIDQITMIATSQKPALVHLKINTGMNRVGCEPKDVLKLATLIKKKPNLILEGVFTHFATAENPDPSGFNKQNELFKVLIDKLKEIDIEPEIIHSCNSAATIKYLNAHHSMVRIGLGIYGIYPREDLADIVYLIPALSLISEISFIKPAKEDTEISYGWLHRFEKNTNVATIPIGYGDGVPRNLGINGGSVLISGVRCPIVGAVTMDQIMVDIGELKAKVGDKVTLIGGEIKVDEWADICNTISWEILCSFSARLPRIYD